MGRLQLGQRVHQAYQKEAELQHPDYESEKHLRWQTVLQGRLVVVSGRADGVYRDTDGAWVVEEVKSWLGAEPQLEISLLPEDVMDAYRWQCAIYAHLLRLSLASDAADADEVHAKVRGELVLVDVVDGTLTRLPVDCDGQTTGDFLKTRLAVLVAELEVEQKRRAGRQRHGRNLTFPFSRFRPHQQELCDNVRGAAESSIALVLSAPTGIGKTAAALYPMLRHVLIENKRLLYVTAKVSQQELALDTLELLLPKDCGVTAVQLEAKERSCPQEEILCVPRHCPRLKNSALRMANAGLPHRLLAGGVLRASRLREEAKRCGLCPFELSLACAYGAEVVVGDMNYAFHPGSRLKRLFTADLGSRRPRPWCLVVDEAHNLYLRALEFLSPALCRKELDTLIEGCAMGPNPVYRDFLDHLLLIDDLFAAQLQEVAEGPRAAERDVVVDIDARGWLGAQMRLEIWLLDYLAYIKSGGRRPLPFVPRKLNDSRRVIDPAIHFCMRFSAFVDAVETIDEHMVAVLHQDTEQGVVLQIHCLDPARYLARILSLFGGVVGMSATMEPLGFYEDVLGFVYRSHARCAFPSPYPPENRVFVADVSVSTRYQKRAAYVFDVAAKLVTLATIQPGNHLVFFPSYAYQNTVVPLIKAEAKRRKAKLDFVAVGPGDKAEEVLELLRGRVVSQTDCRSNEKPLSDSLLVCTVMGGVLSEGVDFPGPMAISAIIVGPALPPVSFERQLMSAYWQEKDGAGFEHAYLYPGLTRVIQAAGRVIRSAEDQGTIILLGERFGEARYRNLLPDYWQQELKVVSDGVAVVDAFWRHAD